MVGCRVMVWNRAENRFRWYHDGLDRQGAKALAKELAPSHITVNAIACGVIDTSMNQCFSPGEIQELIDEIPADRLGKASEIAEIALQLVNTPDYMTGQIITVDGGWY